MELCDTPAHQLVELVRQKQVSAQEILDSALNRISLVDGQQGSLPQNGLDSQELSKIHAFITVTDGLARSQAKEVDRKIAAGIDPGPLAGIPFTVKDIFTVRGTPSTAASKILANFIAPYTGTCNSAARPAIECGSQPTE